MMKAFLALGIATMIIGGLYVGREVLMPLALAALLAFLLSPLVRLLHRIKVPWTGGVIIVTIFAFTVLATILGFVGREVANLAGELPAYKQTIKDRIESVQRMGEGGLFAKMKDFAADIRGDTGAKEVKTDPNAQPPPPPAPSPDSQISRVLNSFLAGMADGLGTAAIVIVFVIFILLRQEDIGQRIIRLAGFNRLTNTTRALDEVGDRISRYLLMQGTVNGIYGLLLGLGLWAIGLPYVVLWGVLAALFRFIPYVGPMIVGVLPSLLSLAVFDGWTQPLLVIGLILVLELMTNMFLEPVLYGQSVGVNDLALLVAITFWTWLWGGVGLVLATPLTVCIVVFCKYIPSADWVEVLMGEKPEPRPYLTLFQQLLNEDPDLADATVEEALEERGLRPTMDTIIIPALGIARRETALGKLSKAEQTSIYEGFGTSLTTFHEHNEERNAEKREAAAAVAEKEGKPNVEEAPNKKHMLVFARAMHGEPDSLALKFLEQCLPDNIEFEISAEPHLIGELVHEIEDKKPAMICISSLPPDTQASASVLCRRLRNRLPNLKILVCSWTVSDEKQDHRAIREAGASWVAMSSEEACQIMTRFAETGT